MTETPTDKKLSIEPKRSAELAFEDGALCINLSGYGDKDGASHIAFNDDALEYEPHEEDDGTTRWQRLPKSELIAIRDFLIKHFPTTESHPSAIREAVEGEREACAKIAERFAEQNRQQAIESKRRANKLNGLGGEIAEILAERAEIASMECDAAFHEADAIAAAIRARGEEKGQ